MGTRNTKLGRGKGKGKTTKQIATGEGSRIYSHDYYDFTFYNLQLWAAAQHGRIRRSRQTYLTKPPPTPRQITPFPPHLAESHA